MKENEINMVPKHLEYDACGIGFVAHLKGNKTHKVVDDAITMLENMQHRGGTGYEPNTGDGAGILLQVPHEFCAEECKRLGLTLPDFGGYGTGLIFFPQDIEHRKKVKQAFAALCEKFGFDLIGFRKVPTINTALGDIAKALEPCIEQVFVKENSYLHDLGTFERRLFVLRRYSNPYIRKTIPEAGSYFYINSLSYKTIVYKGQLNADQLRGYYPDLSDSHFKSALAMVHSRFSTNTFPNWKLAQPFRFIAHNGEINTIRGNINWMKSYESLFRSSLFTKEEIENILPLLDENQSDSSNLDKVVELLLLGGRSLPHVMMMLIPEAWENDNEMQDPKKAFYEYHSSLMEPWDGPASICFTDGKMIGACLDRNGLRPSRYCITDDDFIIMSSETGALPVDPTKVVVKGRLEPGKIFIADLEQGRIISDEELKKEICSRKPYREWLTQNSVAIEDLPDPTHLIYEPNPETLLQRQQAFGFSYEDLKVILSPMMTTGHEPIGSMGHDSPIAILSKQSHHLTNYFKQQFAQVSNPPMDSIRERNVMALFSSVGKTLDILSEKPTHCILIEFKQPVLTNQYLERIRSVMHPNFRTKVIDTIFPANSEPGTLEIALNKICQDAEAAIRFGSYNILIFSDRKANKDFAPIPSILVMGAIQQHLIDNGMRVRCGIIIEAGDVREVHHFATLIGYGANAINPYMAFESITALRKNNLIDDKITDEQAIKNYINAIDEGLLKVFAKMGISTLRSYHGSQIFEIVGLSSKVVKKCFTGTVSRIEGLDFNGIAKEVLIRQRLAYEQKPTEINRLLVGGLYSWKRKGETHLLSPDTVSLLQQAVRNSDYKTYKKYTEKINNQRDHLFTLRGLLEFKDRKPILLEEVEPVEKIFRRFATGAMSFGSISYEAHSTIAVAMNRIGGKSNSGEGGEDEARFDRKPNGDWERSAIKQVASGRFGVSIHYLANADELQIKIAQGAKPGEGGQLPGYKVDEWIARVRNSTPGVGLISPPPHHDIYSIEDLKQLIFDLRNANPKARISVKLVSEYGVGTIAAGVAKAHADAILVSGFDGGTGASPVSSIRHAGLPWEMGISEAHQTLVANNLRSRVVLQADGQLRTGRDIAIAALLGAEEWGVATGALISLGCIMMRKCHSNTCPVGVATQDVNLRKKFSGKPEHVINFVRFLAEDLREVMAQLGFHTVDEMIGQADVLKVRENIGNWKAASLNLAPIISKYPAAHNVGLYKQIDQEKELGDVLDVTLIEISKDAIESGTKVKGEFNIRNVNRATGTMLSYHIAKKYGKNGLPDDTIHIKLNGSAGQSFGAFGANGMTLELEGDANDYFGKGLSGARIIVYPDKRAKFIPSENALIGNVAFYGGIKGEAYIRGMAGQRYCVRNSGVTTVVEGVGAHCCEYMTGGIAVILGITGKNFAAGMSGGIAYVNDIDGNFESRCNMGTILLEQLEDSDKVKLKELITNHLNYTGSDVAQNMLADWDNAVKKFVKVMPIDYKAALKKLLIVNG